MFKLNVVLLISFISVCVANLYNETFLENLIASNILINSSCVSDLSETAKAIFNGEIWALKMIDAASKLQSGLVEGNLANLGSYDECLSIKHDLNADKRIEGKYCLYAWMLPPEPIEYVIKYPEIMNAANNFLQKHDGVPIVESICIPQSCSAKDLTGLIDSIGLNDELFVKPRFSDQFCEPNEDFRPFSYVELFTVFLIGGSIVCMLVSTIYDFYILHTKTKPFHDILLSFSVYSNFKKLTTVRRDPDQIPCINGIRTISMMWVLLGHRFLINGIWANINYLYLWAIQDSSNIIIGATVSVDTFFVISGVLVIYVVLLAKAKKFNINLFYYYIHRMLRLSPALYMVVLIHMTMFRYMGSGPLWPLVRSIIEEPCWNNWWKSLIFIQNTQKFGDICVGHSWYLAVDTQLYVLAPLIFLPIKQWPAPTIITIVILTFISCYLEFISAWNNHIGSIITALLTPTQEIYTATYLRMHSWLIGTLLGYFLFVKRGQKLRINKVLVVILWMTSIACMLAVVFSNTHFFKSPYNRLISSMYIGFSRALWSISLCWVIFACVHGYGGYINKFLSMRIFIIIGRLTYSIYLVHFVTMLVLTGQKRVTDSFSNLGAIYLYMADLGWVLIISLFWSLAFESPIIAIGKILLPAEMAKRLKEMNENGQSNNNALSTYL